MLRINESAAEAVSAYVAGWSVSRRTPPPEPAPLGWHVASGLAHEPERYVPVRGTESDVRSLAERLTTPLTCVKFAGSHRDWRPTFGSEWDDNPVGWFMTKRLTHQSVERPFAGELAVVADRDLVTAQIALDGQVVASGRAGLAGSWCVPDRIRTSEHHRRRGLGSTVMQARCSTPHSWLVPSVLSWTLRLTAAVSTRRWGGTCARRNSE
ncbi:hypothetical protein [Flexivirga sp. B27]